VYLYLSANGGSDQIRSIVATAHTLENHELENLEKLNCNLFSMQWVFFSLFSVSFFPHLPSDFLASLDLFLHDILMNSICVENLTNLGPNGPSEFH